jgi:myo-inositol-1-phosphate synthase
LTKDPDLTKEQLVKDLKDAKVDVLLNYLPVGSETATRFYVEGCLEAKVPFVNCIPVFIVSDPYWEDKFKEAGIPAIGDDMRSQLGASVLSQALQELFFNRGCTVQFSYIPFQGDNKVANFRIEGKGFGGAPVVFDARLSVQDSPNSAGVVIDALRYVKVAHEMGLVGSLRGPSAASQKTPPTQMMLDDALAECQALANRQLTPSLEEHNLPTVRIVSNSKGDK